MEEGKGRQGPKEMSGREANKVLEVVFHGWDANELVDEMRGGGAEDACELANASVLSGLQDPNEGTLSDISKPHPCSIGKDREKDAKEDFAPSEERGAMDRVTQDAEGMQDTHGMGSKGGNMGSPI